MDTYQQYREARNTAWRALLQLPEKRLPVDAEGLARRLGMEVLPFPRYTEEPKLYGFLEKAGEGPCRSLRIRGRWHIFLRDGMLDDAGRRFAVAHEMGHLLLGHETRSLSPGVRAFASLENSGDVLDDPESLEDYAADIFAVRLLAPACLLHEMHIDQPGRIAALCGLPPRAAALRAERMDILNERDAYYSDPLEGQVRDAFLPFLREQHASFVHAHAESGAGIGNTEEVPVHQASDAPPENAPAAEPDSSPLLEAGKQISAKNRQRQRTLCFLILALAAAAALLIRLLLKR